MLSPATTEKYQLRDPNKREISTLAHRAASEALTVCEPQHADGRLGAHVTRFLCA
jgi:hypothetical protein